MARLRSLALRLTLGLTLALAGGSLVLAGCSKPKPAETKKDEKKKQKKKQKKKPRKPTPKNPWLDEVLAQAEVTVTYTGGKPIHCKWDAKKKKHLCPDQERWVYVGPEVRRVGKQDAYCVWQHPVNDGVVTTKLKGIAKQPLELRHAFAGRSYTVTQAAPVDIVVRVDGKERVKAQRLREPGFAALRVEAAEAGKPGDLELEVSTKHDGVAHFCWQLEKLPDGAPAAAPEVKAASAAPTKSAEAKASDGKASDAKASGAKADEGGKVEAAATPSTAEKRPVRKINGRLRLPPGAKLKPAIDLKTRKALEAEER